MTDAAPAAPPRSLRWKVLALVLVVLGVVGDLVSKAAIQRELDLDPDARQSARSVEVIPGFLRFEGTWNEGITFGMAPGHTNEIKVFTLVACAAILVWLLATRSRSRVFHAALGMILGGALGNLYDRFQWNKVRDFILVYWKDPSVWHWHNFNVADSLIVVGVILVLWQELFGRRRATAPSVAGTT
jgi:signal peptidase II